MAKTIQLDVTTSVPVVVLQEAMAVRALTILEHELAKALKHAINEFVANGISAELEKTAVRSEKTTLSVSKD